jgi:hypothetical protein
LENHSDVLCIFHIQVIHNLSDNYEIYHNRFILTISMTISEIILQDGVFNKTYCEDLLMDLALSVNYAKTTTLIK